MGMYNPNSFIDKLVEAGVIEKRVFSFVLSKDRSGFPSILTLGGYDISEYMSMYDEGRLAKKRVGKGGHAQIV